MTRLLLVAAAAFVCGCSGASPVTDPLPADAYDALQGRWVAIRGEVNGQSNADAKYMSGFKFIFEGRDVTSISPEELRVGEYLVDQSQRPATITMKFNGGVRIEGIIGFQQRHLYICVAPPGEPRPTEFSSRRGTQIFFTVMRKESEG